MIILAFESSCDETSVAVADFSEGSRRLLSNRTASQVALHALYGGVVPEIASRAHTEAISSLTYDALSDAGISLSDVDAVAVTSEPGLIGALLVAVSFAKGLAFRYSLPLVPVNHIHGHVAAAYYEHPGLEAPFFSMVASGGHTSLMDVRTAVDFVTVGRTRDDAIGEAFDKVARLFGIAYPGGAAMDVLAARGDPGYIKFPSAALDGLDFSFSGLKTAVVNHVHSLSQKGLPVPSEDIAASFTAAVVKAVVTNLSCAHDRFGYKTLVIAGGAASNSHLRKAVAEFSENRGIELCMPSPSLCSDNAAMIAAQGFFEFSAGNTAGLSLNARPTSRTSEK